MNAGLIAACTKRADTLFWLGEKFLYLALIVATLLALVSLLQSIVALFTKTSPAGGEGGGDGIANPITPVVDAVTKLIDALSKAPTWFAMAVVGFALFWLASSMDCGCHKPAPPPTSNNSAGQPEKPGNETLLNSNAGG